MAAPISMPASDLGQALIAGIQHYGLGWTEEAAIRFLIAQETWLLSRNEFREHVTLVERKGRLTAWVDWPGVAREPDASPASGGERAALRMACLLAGSLPTETGSDWTLHAILTRLDVRTSLLASRAVAIAALGPDAVGPLA